MLRSLVAVFILTMPSVALAENTSVLLNPNGDDQHPIYIEVVVTACAAVETALQPTGQGDIPAEHRSMTHEERIAYLAKIGCINVPIPPEWLTREMTYAACTHHGGWQAAIEFLQKRQDLKATPEVGQTECIVSDHPFESVASQ
jgi:hypothetical protein